VEGPAAGVGIYVDDLALREQPLANLVSNGDFESGAGGWFGWGPSQIAVTTDALSGSQAGIATGRTDTWNGIATDLTGSVQPEGSYQATAFAKVRGDRAARAHGARPVRRRRRHVHARRLRDRQQHGMVRADGQHHSAQLSARCGHVLRRRAARRRGHPGG
jgi:hypothetical protein